MRKLFLILVAVIALGTVMGCNSKKGTENEVVGDSLQTELKRAGIDSVQELNNDFAIFFTSIYNDELYNDYAFIDKYCTEKLKKKLKEAYEYEGDGYATWLFRSEFQDGPTDEHKLTKIVPEDDGWYKYDFIDMGHKGSHRIKVLSHVNPRNQIEYYIDELE